MTAKTGKKTERKSTGKAGKGASRAKTRKAPSRSPRGKKSKTTTRPWAAFAAGALAALLLLAGASTLYMLLRSPDTPVKPAASTPAPRKTPPPGAVRDRAVTAPSVLPSPTVPPEPVDDAPSATDGAVRQALQDLQNLPYEEAGGPSLEETVGRIDYALLQVLRRLGLPADALRVAASEERTRDKETYTFRRLEPTSGELGEAFERELERNLRWWAESAEVKHSGKDALEIFVKGVPTHRISLRPGGEVPVAPDSGRRALGPERLRGEKEEPRLVIVIDDMGASMGAVRRLLALKYPVTFAFWPHAAHVREGAEAAHAAGREILVHMPMEPEGYPNVKPGPNVLLRGASTAQIRLLVNNALDRVPYAVGLNNHMGSRFTRDREGVRVVLEELRKRNLFMLDSLTHPRSVFYDEARNMSVPGHRRDVFLDHVISRRAILAALRRAEETALLTGRAVAIGHPHPETLEVLKEWERLRNPVVRIVRLRDLPR